MTDVSAVIAARQHRPEPFGSVLAWSIGAHAALVVFFVFGPDWHMVDAEPPKVVMTISLAGAPGPRAGGLSQMGGRSVPLPRTDVPTRAMPPPPPKAEPAMSTQRSRRPVAQPEPVEEPEVGVTRTDTGTRGQGFGLSTGGSGSNGVQLDVSNFCCPEYIEQMVSLIHRNWQQGQGVRGATVMKFTIARSGLIQDVMVERPSGFLALDLASERALLATRLPELPAPFPNPSLTVHITFDYSR